MSSGEPSPTEAVVEQETRLADGASRRMNRTLYGASLALIVVIVVVFGKAPAFGFAVGAGLATFNFAWQHRTSRKAAAMLVANVQDQGGARLTGMSLTFGTVARLALVTAAGYAIFSSSIQSFYGFLGGLFMPILAVFAEALYESWNALRHRS